MKKRTVISSHTDWRNHTAYVKNQGIEELKIFKQLKDNGIELKDEEISDEEICMILNHLCTDGIIEAVFSIENHFNRDQATINKAKNNIEEKLKTKGLTIITHCDWSPSFNDGGSSINSRNYLTLLTENIKEKENQLYHLEKELEDEIQNINVIKNNKLQELKDDISFKKDILERELGELNNEIEKNKSKIKQQNWFLNESKEYETKYKEQKEKFDKLVERYKNGEKYIEEQKEKLPIEVKKLIEEKESLDEDLKTLKLMIKEKTSALYNINNELTLGNKQLQNINDSIVNRISIILNSITTDRLSFKEAKEKFMRTVKMYIINNREVPEFEKEAAKVTGLDENTIEEIINLFKKNISINKKQ